MISYDGFGGKIWEFINFKGLITHAFVLSYFLACLYFCSVLFVIKHFLFQQLLSGCLPFPSNFFRSSSRKKGGKGDILCDTKFAQPFRKPRRNMTGNEPEDLWATRVKGVSSDGNIFRQYIT